MKRSRKTLFALLLALVMTLGLAATAWAAEGDSGTVVGPLPDGPVINQPTPEVPEAYKIPFTKVVEQKGAFAPGPKDFSLEAFLLNENGGADTPFYKFSFDTSGTGIGSFSSEMTIPANVLGNRDGFYVREVNGGASGWTYSEDMYYASFSIDASAGIPMVFGPRELSKILGISKNKTYEVVNRYDFPKIRVGRRIIISKKHFLEWMDANFGKERNNT